MKSVQARICLYHAESSVWPLIDIYETESELVFEIDLPGVGPEDVSITADGDVLILEGTVKHGESDAGLKYICMERGTRRFRRVIKFPVPVHVSEGTASCSRGVISVRFPKLERRAIAIKVRKIIED